MGSWNETCMISNLPIQYGDKVVYLLITGSPYKSDGCYHNSYFHMRSIPVYGKYDDYGCIAPDSDPVNSLVLESIKQQFIVDRITESPGDFNFDTLQSTLHEDHLMVDANTLLRLSNAESRKRSEEHRTRELKDLNQKTCPYPPEKDKSSLRWRFVKKAFENWDDYRKKQIAKLNESVRIWSDVDIDPIPRRVCRVMIRRDVWDSIISMTLSSYDKVFTIASYKDDADKWLIDFNRHLMNLKKFGDDEEGKYQTKRAISNLKFDADYNNLFASHFVACGSAGGNPAYGMHCGEAFKMLCTQVENGELDKEALRPIAHRLSELAMLETVMARSRMAIHPTGGVGSQSANFTLTMELHRRMANCAQASVENEISKLRAENDPWATGEADIMQAGLDKSLTKD